MSSTQQRSNDCSCTWLSIQPREHPQKAKEYLEKITKEPFGLSSFISKNEMQLNAMAGKKGFDIQHALTGKKNYKEYRILVNFITAKMTLREIEIFSQNELF